MKRSPLLLLLFLIVAVAGLFYGIKYFKTTLESDTRQPAPRVVLSGAQPIDGINAGPRESDADQPRISVPQDPSVGNTYHVKAGAAEPGDGSKQQPWSNLQQALCMLRPGDRLLIWPGSYAGPVAIDGDCVNGTAERPIEVYSSDHAFIAGQIVPKRAGKDKGQVDKTAGERKPIQTPTVRIARSYWHFGGVEIQPSWHSIGIEIGPEVSGVKLDALHLWGGIGDAISVLHGSSDILLEKIHIHHFGTLEGKSQGYFDDQAAAIRIAPGVSGITARLIKTHNIAGQAVQVVEPQDYTPMTGLMPAEELDLDVAERENQEKWW